MANRILQVVLTGKDDGALGLMAKLGQTTEQTTGKVGGFGRVGTAAMLGVGAAAAGLALKSVQGFERIGSEVRTLQRYTGGSAEDMSKLRFVAQQTGLSMETLAKSLGLASKNMVKSKDTVADFGIVSRTSTGAIRPMNEILLDVAEKFQKMPNGAEKTAYAMKLFGRSGAEMIPMLNRGKDGIAELMAQTEKYGLVLGDDQVEAVKKYKESQRQLTASLEGLEVKVGTAVIPRLTQMTTVMSQIPGPVMNIAGPVLGAGVAFAGLALVVDKVRSAAAPAMSVLSNLNSKISGGEGVTAAATARMGGYALAIGLVLAANEKMKSDSAEFSAKMFKGLDFTDLDQSNAKLGQTKQQILDGMHRWQEYGAVEKLVHITEGKNLRDAGAQFEEHAKHQRAAIIAVQDLDVALHQSSRETKALLSSLNIDPTTVPFDKLVDVLGRLKAGTITAGQAQLELSKAADDAAGSEADLGKATEDAAKIRGDANKKWKDATGVLKDYFGEAKSHVDLERSVAESADAFAQTLVDNNKTLWGAWKIGTKEGRENQKAFEDAATAALDLGLANVQAGGDIGQNAQAVNDQVGRLREQAIRYGISAAAVDDLIARLHLTPPEVNTQFNAPGLAEARANVEALNNAIGPLQGGLQGVVATAGTLVAKIAGSSFGAAVGRLTGGQIHASGGNLVHGLNLLGDRGPELVNVDNGGNVTTAGSTARALAGGGGTTINVNVAGSVVSERDLFTVLQRAALEAQRVSATPVLPGVSG